MCSHLKHTQDRTQWPPKAFKGHLYCLKIAVCGKIMSAAILLAAVPKRILCFYTNRQQFLLSLLLLGSYWCTSNEGLLCVCGLCNVRERTEPRLSFQGFLSQLHCYSIVYRSSRRKQMLITPRDALQLRRLEKAGLEKGLWFGLEDRETKGGTHMLLE